MTEAEDRSGEAASQAMPRIASKPQKLGRGVEAFFSKDLRGICFRIATSVGFGAKETKLLHF